MEGAVQSLATNVGQLLSEEYKRLRRVRGEIAELQDDLSTMNALIHMQSQADERSVDSFVREWMKQLREVAFDADNCVDRYIYRVRSRPGVGTWAWLKRLLTTLSERHRLSTEIGALRARTTAICERHARYGINLDALRNNTLLSPLLDEPPPSTSASPASPVTRGLHADRQPIVGISDAVERLVYALNDNLTGMVFSIVGPAGIGKTTLAMKVCQRLQEEFPYQAMVTIPQDFDRTRDLEGLVSLIIQQFGVAVDLRDSGASLSDKRYLILIDDVWTIDACNAIISRLLSSAHSNNCGSRIIVTTRMESVANAYSHDGVGRHIIFHMEALNIEDSKKLFVNKAFGNMDDTCPDGLEEVMVNILKKCGGLPLAIVSIANIWAGYRSSYSRDKWKAICQSIDSQLQDNVTYEGWIKHIVTLSYNHLPHELKVCMMYLSMYPKKYEINKDRLLGTWVAEGFVPEKRGWTLIEVAEYFFDELVRRNMVKPHFRHDGKVESCQVHDVLLEVLVSKSLESDFVSLLGGDYTGMSYDRIRRLSIQGGDKRLLSLPKKKKMGRGSRHSIEGINVEHVRSLTMFGHGRQKLLDHLDKFTLLRVLDLQDCEGLTNDHMRYICRLDLLKFLNLNGTDISEVPPQVERLEHLQTLDVGNTRLHGIPETVTNLEKLDRLSFYSKDGWEIMWKLPRGLSKMKMLRVLSNVALGSDVEVAREVGELEQLQELTIAIGTYTIDNEDVLNEFAKSMSKMSSLRSLNLADLGSTTVLKFVHELPTPPRLLRYLRISGETGGMLPHWIGSLTYLVEFAISGVNLSGDEPFGILCMLPNLRSISLEQRYYTSNELVARSGFKFPALVNLAMTCNWSNNPTPKVYKFEAGAMPKLETLLLDFKVYKDKSIGGIEHLTNLREVQLIGEKSNPAVTTALEQLKAERGRRPDTNQFQVAVKYE